VGTEQHPWGQSHSEGHQPVNPLAFLTTPIVNITPEQIAAADAAYAQWKQKQGGTLGDLLGLLKGVFFL
jgi:hypothetical protein